MDKLATVETLELGLGESTTYASATVVGNGYDRRSALLSLAQMLEQRAALIRQRLKEEMVG